MPLPLTVSCFSEIQIGFTFWYRLTWVVPEKGPLNVCVCVCVCVSLIVWPGLTHAEIIAQGILFFLGGFENTANTLSFLAYQLAVNTDCQDKVIQEIDNVMNGQVRQPCCIHAVTELWRESKHCCLNSMLQVSQVLWSVCVGHTDELCKNGWTDWYAIWGQADSCGLKKPCVRWGAHWLHLANMIEWSIHSGDTTYVKYFDHLLILEKPTYAQYFRNFTLFFFAAWFLWS